MKWLDGDNLDMKVGLALGGGGVRGLAHVLALETLDACGIRPAIISGTSMGAIVGAMYASGFTGKEMHELIERRIIMQRDGLKEVYRKKRELLKWLSIVRPSWGTSGLLKADGMLHFLMEEIQVERFEELEIPLRVVAADFYKGTPVVFHEGELMPAIQASMSIPGVFVPVKVNDRILVDGGIVNNLPYDLLMDECDVTIAIDVNPPRDDEDDHQPSLIDVTLGIFDILVDRITSSMIEKRPPTIYVRPNLGGTRILDFDKVELVLEQAAPAMEELKEKLAQVSGEIMGELGDTANYGA